MSRTIPLNLNSKASSPPLNYLFWQVSLTGRGTEVRLIMNYFSTIQVHNIGIIQEIVICRRIFARIYIQPELSCMKFLIGKISILVTLWNHDISGRDDCSNPAFVDAQIFTTISAAEKVAERMVDWVQQTHSFSAIKAFSPVKCCTNLVSTPPMTGNTTLLAQHLVRVPTKFSAVFAEEVAFPTTCRD